MDLFGRLSDYDIFAYAPQGALALAAADYAVGGSHLLHNEWTVFDGFIFFILAYVTGHLISSVASFVIERWVVRSILGQPSKVLLRSTKPSWFAQKFFGDYMTPMHEPMRSRVVDALGINPNVASGEEIFWRAYPIASRDPIAKARLESFLNLYGFCRNTCVVFAAIGLWGLLEGAAHCAGYAPPEDNIWLITTISLIVSVMLFYRYLKFHRLYALEVLKTFGTTPPDRSDKVTP